MKPALMNEEWAEDGAPATLVQLSNENGMHIVLMDIGATWLSCQLDVDGEPREVLLGVGAMSDFKRHTSYMGATVGRYANRIAGGVFHIEDVKYHVSTNQAGHCLHGGAQGFDKRRWTMEDKTQHGVTFSLVSPDGDQGFPGRLCVFVRYELTQDNQLVIDYRATTDKPTPVNLTNHAYFNLSGQGDDTDCLAHKLCIKAGSFLPTDETGIPLGDFKSVKGTGFDFNQPKTIASHLLEDKEQISSKGYDHSFIFERDRDTQKPVAMLVSPDEKITLRLFTDKPAVQLYTGNWLSGEPNRKGGVYNDYSGVALETQFLPDAINHPQWEQPSSILTPEKQYRYFTRYQFEF